MSTPWWGLIASVVFGAVAVGMMLPMAFPDKRTALVGAFVDRLGIGIVIGCVQLPWPGWAIGLSFGLLLSLPRPSLPRRMCRSFFWAGSAGW
jgi:hypothetical protein